MKWNRSDGGKASRCDVNRDEDVADLVAKLNRAKRKIMWHLAHELEVATCPVYDANEEVENLLRNVMFARPWCNNEEPDVYRRKNTKVTRTIYNLILESKKSWIDELKRHKYLDEEMVVDVVCPLGLLPIKLGE